MTVNKRLRAAKYGYILVSILICILGAALIALPDFSPSLLRWIGGILLIGFGCIKILGYVSKDLYRLAFQFDLAFGILLIAVGLILILHVHAMIHSICILMGMFILADSLLKVQIALDSKAFGIHPWWAILSAAVVTGICGFLLVFRSYGSTHVEMLLLGVSFLAEGVLNLVTVLSAVQILQRQERFDDPGISRK